MSTTASFTDLARLSVLLAVPVAYLLTLVAARGSAGARWQLAERGAVAALAAACAGALWVASAGAWAWQPPALLQLPDGAGLSLSLRSDAAGALVLLLVTFIGWVIVRYAGRYLNGEAGPRQLRFLRALAGTLVAVSVVVLANNLAVLALAWMTTSLTLHLLLTHYEERWQAVLVAHKKFIASRVADLCLLSGIGLLAHATGTLEIDQLASRLQDGAALPQAAHAGLVLVALCVLLKCAQLPFHGWLIQVMEAPTPVSALLHAGVVNLGGFVLIRLAEPLAQAPAAQWLLLVVGSLTAAVAALVMTTRISVKVMLAWSTCAQMGFMLMQCALGAYELALLHLLAHSLYKAHAFLSAGTVVEQARIRQLSAPAAAPGLARSLAAAVAALLLVAGIGWTWGLRPEAAPALWALGGVLCLALAPSLAVRTQGLGGWWFAAVALAAAGVANAYALLHHVFALAVPPQPQAASVAMLAWVVVVFTLLFVLQSWLRAHPQGALARRLYPWCFAGLYLDELFTRLTFRVWPARHPRSPGVSA